ncbi:hypothetical protein BN903_216 [Halorubrum sp. AJ67]|nr:hypothetical protein BN903_216 [Halorubrum sp. AJ67]
MVGRPIRWSKVVSVGVSTWSSIRVIATDGDQILGLFFGNDASI